MRLTLRTLLAYMDDILDPADQESLAKQVEESEVATEILHRTRDAVRRLRLGAPPVTGEGMDIDPNAAAEYLDNTLSSEDMADYDRVCLDSDVHLAEVASCHHILTMVLGEPAEIDPAMRERMYKVPSQVDDWRKLRLDGPHPMASTAAATEVTKSDKPAEKATPKSVADKQTKPEVPDYLKASDSSRLGRMGLMFAAALLLGFGGFVLFGPGGILTDSNPTVADGDTGDNGKEPDIVNPENNDQPPTDPNTGTPETPNEDETSGLPEIRGLDPSEEPAGTPAEGGTPIAEPDGAADAGEAPVEFPPIEVPPLPDAEDPVVDVAEGTQPEPVVVDDNPRVAMNPNVDGAVEGAAEEPAVDVVEDPTEVADPVPSEPMPMGTTVTPQQVLLRWDEAQGEWLRLPKRASIIEGDQLMSLPTYRPSLMLVSGLRLEMSDGSKMKLGFADNGKTHRLEATYGRFLMQNTGMEMLEIEISIGDETKRVALEPRSVLGMEIDRPFISGADVENSLGAFRAMFYAPLAKVTWDIGGAALATVGPAQWEWHDGELSSLTDQVAWLDGQSLDYLESNVSTSFERRMDTTSSARLQLLEFYETSRRREEKAIASMCATHVGQFIPFVEALADTQQQSNWDDHIDQLRLAMSRSTQAAKMVHETLTEQRGADLADDLFAMLRGYSPEQVGTTPDEVRSGITRQLINWLENDRLEYRVLAIHNLKDIYGGKTLGYNPVITEPSRLQRSVKTWRTRLADNELEPAGR